MVARRHAGTHAPNVIRQTVGAAFQSGPFCYVKSIVIADDRTAPFCYAYEWETERFSSEAPGTARRAAWRHPGCFPYEYGLNKYALST